MNAMANDDKARPRATGGCLCGSVRFEVHGALKDVLICHCRFCQRMHTHVGAYASCAPSDLRIISGHAALVSFLTGNETGVLPQMRQFAVLGADARHPYLDFGRQLRPTDRAHGQGAHFSHAEG
jgi:hypothetical protein